MTKTKKQLDAMKKKRAQDKLLKDLKKMFSSPYAWGCFLIIGGCTAMLNNQDSSYRVAKEPWEIARDEHWVSMRSYCHGAIKGKLKDPSSFKAEDTSTWPSMEPDPALVMVKVKFRAKNSFGAYTSGNGVCHADSQGKILKSKILD